jgi:hypothetical protein
MATSHRVAVLPRVKGDEFMQKGVMLIVMESAHRLEFIQFPVSCAPLAGVLIRGSAHSRIRGAKQDGLS